MLRGGQKLGTAIALLAAVTFGACSLNPQPIPPGYEGDNAFAPPMAVADASARSDSATSGGTADSGSNFSDATANPSIDASGPPDALDGGDASTDAPTDAPQDAPADATND